jgi:uncharacterized protein YegP (UPF0339 family)
MSKRSYIIQPIQSRKDGKWRIHLLAGNGEIIMVGQAYSTKYSAIRTAKTLETAGIQFKDAKGVPQPKRRRAAA